jgi:hypothetical protein
MIFLKSYSYGFSVGTLNIYQKGFRDEYPETKKLWTLFTNTTGINWYYQQITIGNDFSESDYKILIEGVISQGLQGDIAVDDLKFYDGICQPPPNDCAFQCANSTCISETNYCNFVNDCSNGEEEVACGYNTNFENDMGGWTEISDGAFKWIRSKGGNPSTNTGPSAGMNLI